MIVAKDYRDMVSYVRYDGSVLQWVASFISCGLSEVYSEMTL